MGTLNGFKEVVGELVRATAQAGRTVGVELTPVAVTRARTGARYSVVVRVPWATTHNLRIVSHRGYAVLMTLDQVRVWLTKSLPGNGCQVAITISDDETLPTPWTAARLDAQARRIAAINAADIRADADSKAASVSTWAPSARKIEVVKSVHVVIEALGVLAAVRDGGAWPDPADWDAPQGDGGSGRGGSGGSGGDGGTGGDGGSGGDGGDGGTGGDGGSGTHTVALLVGEGAQAWSATTGGLSVGGDGSVLSAAQGSATWADVNPDVDVIRIGFASGAGAGAWVRVGEFELHLENGMVRAKVGDYMTGWSTVGWSNGERVLAQARYLGGNDVELTVGDVVEVTQTQGMVWRDYPEDREAGVLLWVTGAGVTIDTLEVWINDPA